MAPTAATPAAPRATVRRDTPGAGVGTRPGDGRSIGAEGSGGRTGTAGVAGGTICGEGAVGASCGGGAVAEATGVAAGASGSAFAEIWTEERAPSIANPRAPWSFVRAVFTLTSSSPVHRGVRHQRTRDAGGEADPWPRDGVDRLVGQPGLHLELPFAPSYVGHIEDIRAELDEPPSDPRADVDNRPPRLDERGGSLVPVTIRHRAYGDVPLQRPVAADRLAAPHARA